MAAYRGTRGVEPPKPKKEKVSKATNSDFIDISSKSTKAVHKKRNTIIQIVSIVMAVLFVVSGGALVYASSIMNSLGDEEGTLTKNTKNYTVKDDRGNGVISDNKLLANKDVLNVMLFGQDSKESKDDNSRSDSMILVSVDVVHKQIKMTSFLRDTYVYIPSGDSNEGWNKLNASYSPNVTTFFAIFIHPPKFFLIINRGFSLPMRLHQRSFSESHQIYRLLPNHLLPSSFRRMLKYGHTQGTLLHYSN